MAHRSLARFKRVQRPGWMKDRIDHNSHLLVLRKRAQPRSRPYAAVTGTRNTGPLVPRGNSTPHL